MNKYKRIISFAIFASIIALILIGIILVDDSPKHETIQEVMKDEVLHETKKISFFGLIEVNPGLISAFAVTVILSVFSVVVRLFVIPKFKRVPGKFQLLLEQAVDFFDKLSKSNSPHSNYYLGAYVFAAGVYVFCSTIFELLGFQAVTTNGVSTTLPAPLSDINGAIAMGFTSYLFILLGGVIANGIRGVGRALMEFSLPFSMSFRLFGAMLSGVLVTELVYYYTPLSFVLPVFVGVIFTLLHAVIQAYVLTMLTALFYGEVTEPNLRSKLRRIDYE